MSIKREHWGSRLGFIMATAGSAIGLGNIWKFPYMAGENGGAAFIIIYLALVFTIGLSVLLAEIMIGRSTQSDAINAFKKLGHGGFSVVGYMGIAAAFMILSFYCVVAGWTIAYIIKFASGHFAGMDGAALGGEFGAFIADPVQPIIYQAVFVALTVFVVLGGIANGIERAGKILMPLLFVILIALVIRAVTLPGAERGLEFFLAPDFSKITGGTIMAALGQAFFS
ncbi:sodium-dependent transporter, partial [uncultured Cohaesibacter sp.]|uniref:sodium-dependent transporter n=1 Tax=uncultured Cohaesibacter sp. TaxID=1002546 RepID=UPI0029C688A5